jgi:molybdate transport repressor ModE-like protein
MEIRELRAFSAVAEEGSVSAAGRKLHLSQSAVSQTIQSLERQLGVQLLVRGAGGVTLTGAGTVLLREARALIAQHDRALAAVSGQAAASTGPLRVGVPLELPADLLPRALAEAGASFAHGQVDIQHASSSAQLSALEAGELDLALVRERPADPDYDAVLAVEEALGVILSAGRAAELTGPTGVRLDQLAGLEWLAFARSEAPCWHDQVAATLRSHGIVARSGPEGESRGGGHPLIAEVKLASVAAGHAFALAPPGWSGSPPRLTQSAGRLPADSAGLPGGVTWSPLVGNPLVRRTWAVWAATATRRDLAALVAALDLTAR